MAGLDQTSWLFIVLLTKVSLVSFLLINVVLNRLSRVSWKMVAVHVFYNGYGMTLIFQGCLCAGQSTAKVCPIVNANV